MPASSRPSRGSSTARTRRSPACSSSPAASTGRSSPAASPGGRGSEGNYWGHNAIIRRRGLHRGRPACRISPGKPPFGGHILSHDFVEAALIRRAGWTVQHRRRSRRLLRGERRPRSSTSPCATAAGARATCSTRRIVGARGLHWVSRFHLVIGIFSYVASPLWLLLILAGLALAVQAQFTPPGIFQGALPALPDLAGDRSRPRAAPPRPHRTRALRPEAPRALVAMLRDVPARRAAGGRRKVVVSFLVRGGRLGADCADHDGDAVERHRRRS